MSLILYKIKVFFEARGECASADKSLVTRILSPEEQEKNIIFDNYSFKVINTFYVSDSCNSQWNISVELHSHSINLNWTSLDDRYNASFNYLVLYNQTNSEQRTFKILNNKLSAFINPVSPSTFYSVKLVAFDLSGRVSRTIQSCTKLVRTKNGEYEIFLFPLGKLNSFSYKSDLTKFNCSCLLS